MTKLEKIRDAITAYLLREEVAIRARAAAEESTSTEADNDAWIEAESDVTAAGHEIYVLVGTQWIDWAAKVVS